ncbi:hypothetical protein ANN_15182 [Periplaneta americana]|uniref:HTH psq-type domain-containing protein n=1 Tax=Periplaneta americana TaxID=6978 RepID=A0ABQ8SFQ8_PERAM|nr:hypothetical protein ANN_15182 [Periplaneta americana]
MPPVISRPSKGKWHPDSMKQAVENVLTGQLSIRKAAEIYNIPKNTLIDRVSAIKGGKEITFTPALGRFKPTFIAEFEGVLLNHVKDLSDRLLPLTRKEFLNLAFQLAEALKIPHHFNCDKKTSGKQFYFDFMKRHPNLSLQTPESTSLNRSIGFNKPQVNRFFESLTNLMEKYEFTPYKIYNCDETSVTTVQKHFKVISLKQNCQVGKLTSAERERSVTVLFCMNAGGQYIPPFFIFPQQRMNERLLIGAPKESIGEAQSNVDQTESPTVKPTLPFPDITSAPKASLLHETSPNRPTPTDRPNDTTVVKETIQQLSPIPDASKKREVS